MVHLCIFKNPIGVCSYSWLSSATLFAGNCSVITNAIKTCWFWKCSTCRVNADSCSQYALAWAKPTLSIAVLKRCFLSAWTAQWKGLFSEASIMLSTCTHTGLIITALPASAATTEGLSAFPLETTPRFRIKAFPNGSGCWKAICVWSPQEGL